MHGKHRNCKVLGSALIQLTEKESEPHPNAAL